MIAHIITNISINLFTFSFLNMRPSVTIAHTMTGDKKIIALCIAADFKSKCISACAALVIPQPGHGTENIFLKIHGGFKSIIVTHTAAITNSRVKITFFITIIYHTHCSLSIDNKTALW